MPEHALAVSDLPPVDLIDGHLSRVAWQLRLKRLFDILAAAALIALLSPLIALVAILIRLESEGPVLFSQKRWGLNGRMFRCFKLRSMYTQAEAEPRDAARDGVLRKMAGDPRVTRVGRFIRKTSIDELPQLWNVLVGDMSLVGPRPLVPHMLEPYPDVRSLRCRVRPGITGLWQVNDRANNTHVFAMLPYDAEYVRSVNLWLDARILVQTVRVVIRGAGAI